MQALPPKKQTNKQKLCIQCITCISMYHGSMRSYKICIMNLAMPFLQFFEVEWHIPYEKIVYLPRCN